ncbi:flagellar filament capping protein FliD [Pseudomonas sp. PLMAX]|jgi:flagellar hook-associated protein 2|uniref:flagellar filament capping protein FliD n=1 Tax=Pseudomonas sp. PLMAX TaxID=2201998 RepID=UPI0038B72323
MASISTIGVGSGLPLDSLLTQIEAAERSKLTPITTKQKSNTAKISAYGSLKSSLTELQKTVQALKQSKTFSPTSATSSGTGVSVAASSGAVAGSYQVKVNTLAQAHNVATENFSSKTDPIAGAGKLTIGVGGKDVDIDIAEGSTLETIRNQINNSGAGVSATIINTGDATNPYKLSIASKTTGTDNQVSVSFAGTGDLSTKLNDAAHGGSMTQVQAAANAEIEVNGISISSQSNTLEEAIGGVTMTVNQAGSTQTVTVAKDTGAVKTSIQSFVDAYNAYIKTTASTTSFNEDPTLSGKLLGDSTLRGIKSTISDSMNTAQTGEYQIMAQFGVKLNVDGTLVIDDEKLTKAIETNGDAVTSFFSGTDGFATRLDKTLTNLLSTEGPLETATAGLTKANESLTEQADKMEDSIQATVSRYRTQFSSLDTLVSKNNSTMSYLTEQFNIMAKNSSSS